MSAREDLAEVIRDGVGTWRTPLEAADAIIAAGWTKETGAFPIIRDLADPDDCWFDHHGGCQAHGYLSLEPGETCAKRDAKEWLKANEGSES